MSIQSTAFDSLWDVDHFPFDLPEQVKSATTPSIPPIPSKWDPLESPLYNTPF